MSDARASITTDTSGWFKAVSPAFLELIGRPVESLAGVNLIDLVHPHDAVAIRRLLAEVGAEPTGAAARVFVAGDVWQPLHLRAVDAGEGRVTVELAPQASTTDLPAAVDPAAPADPVQTAPTAASDEASTPTTAEAAAPAPQDRVDAALTPQPPTLQVATVSDAVSFAAVADPDLQTSPAGADVPSQRAQVRASVPAGLAMLEIDDQGHTTFVTGPWVELSATDRSGSNAFEELVENAGAGIAVLDMIAEVAQTGSARQVQVSANGAPHWLQLRPIPSPHRDGVHHVLVAVSPERAPGEALAGAPASFDAPGSGRAQAVTAATAEAETTPSAVAAEPGTVVSPEAAVSEAAVVHASAATEPDQTATEPAIGEPADTDTDQAAPVEAEKSGRGFFGWLVIALALVLAAVIISRLWPSGDGSSSSGPVDIEIANFEPVLTQPGQQWRSTGVASLGEVHGVAATADNLFVAGTSGVVVKLDASGAAQSALSIGGDETSFVSDIAAASDGAVWVLDAGRGQLYRIVDGATVREVATDQNPLRNARGIGTSPDGMAWIASTAGAQLSKIAPDGATVELISLPGRQPSDVVDLGDGTLWIVDAEQLELAHLTLAGEVLRTIALDQFTSVESPHLSVDGDTLWVTEPEMSATFAVDLSSGEATGERIVLTGPNEARVNKPIGIATDGAGRLWITDSTGNATIVVE